MKYTTSRVDHYGTVPFSDSTVTTNMERQVFVHFSCESERERTVRIKLGSSLNSIVNAIVPLSDVFNGKASHVLLETWGLKHNYELHAMNELEELFNGEDPVHISAFIDPASKSHKPLNIVRKVLAFSRYRSNGNILKDEMGDEIDMSVLGNLRPLFPASRKISISNLEDELSAYRITWGAWRHETGNKTVEDLFDEVVHKQCSLYADDLGAIRIVELVRVKVIHPVTKLVLVEGLKMINGKKKTKHVESLPAYKCKVGDGPYHTAMENLYFELGDMLSLSDDVLAPQVLRPLGFEEEARLEIGSSRSFPGLRTTYYVNVFKVEVYSDNIPSSGSFTCPDLQKNNVVRLWLWRSQDSIPVTSSNAQENESEEKIDKCEVTTISDLRHYRISKLVGLRGLALEKEKRMSTPGYLAPASLYTRLTRRLIDDSHIEKKELEKQIKLDQANMTLPVDLSSIDAKYLRDWLEKHDVDTGLWGKGQAKRVDQLLGEIQKGEAELSLVDTIASKPRSWRNSGIEDAHAKKVLRVIKVAKVDIVCPTDRDMVLVETHQQLSDGRLRVRYKTLSEKFKPTESPWTAGVRGIMEELIDTGIYIVQADGTRVSRTQLDAAQVKKGIKMVSMHAPKTETENSSSYPNLETRYILHRFSCTVDGLPTTPFRTDEASTTHFWRWERRDHVEKMSRSLIKQVQFYRSLTDNHMYDNNLMEEWLFRAAAENQVDVIKLLCGVQNNEIDGSYTHTEENGNMLVKPTVTDKKKNTPLCVAALNDSREAVEALIRIQIDHAQSKQYSMSRKSLGGDCDIVNQPDLHGRTLIYYAAVANCADLVQELLCYKNVAVNSVCLHSCISRGAVDVLPIILARLRYEDSTPIQTRLLFGVEDDNSVDLTNETEKKRYTFESPRADSFATFESLLLYTKNTLGEQSRKRKHLAKGSGKRDLYTTTIDALEVLLQYCKPFFIYQQYLQCFLREIIETDNREYEIEQFNHLIAGSRYPLHAALCAANSLKYRDGVEKRHWDAYDFHANYFQDMACGILDACEDQDEAEQLLRERSDIPAWVDKDGIPVQRIYAHRRKATCAYLAVKYMLKKVVAHKYFTTQNDAIWYGDVSDSLYTKGIGGIQAHKHFNKRRNAVSAFRTYLLRIPGFTGFFVQAYRLAISFLLMVFLALSSPILALLPYSYSLRVLIDIPRTEYASCYYKWSTWCFSYIWYLIAFACVASMTRTDDINDPCTTAEFILYVFWAANVCGIKEQVDTIGFGPFVQHAVNIVDTLSCLCVFLALSCRFVLPLDSPLETYDIFMSLGSLLACFRLYHMFSASKSLGPLWITIVYVATDVGRFLCLLSVTLVAFMFAFLFLFNGKGVTGFESFAQVFSSLLWSTFEAFTGYNPNQTYQKELFQFFLFFFLLIAAVLLTNLLIAMMTDRYNAVQQTAKVEWLFSLAQLIEKYSNMPLLPPPFNLLVFIPNTVFRFVFGRISLYDPDSFVSERESKVNFFQRCRKQVVPVHPTQSAKSVNPIVNREEIVTLNYRTTRRLVLQRYTERLKIDLAQRTETKQKLTHLVQGVEKLQDLMTIRNNEMMGNNK